jgi:hypothetical protein
MKKTIGALSAIFLMLGMSGASAVTKVTVTPQYKVSHKLSQVTLTFSGLPNGHGIYVMQCMAPKRNQMPTKCDPSETSKVWISSVAGDQQIGAQSGKSKVTMKVDAYFKGGDCIHTTCVLFVTNDHNAQSDRSEDQIIPFKFA